MANRNFKKDLATLQQGVVKLYATIVTSTSGAISSTSAKGLSVSKVGSEAGRYRITLEDSYVALLAAQAIVTGAADTAYTTAKGSVAILRNVDVANKTLDIQLVRSDTTADAEVEDAATIHVEITLKNSSL